VSGKQPNFSAEQVQALRRALREYHARQEAKAEACGERWSQGRTAEAIGVSQQVAGRLLGKETAGLSNPTAIAIVSLEGFDGVDEFFRAHTPSTVVPANERGNRDLGIKLAQRAGIADAAIDLVLAGHASSQYDNRPAKWWLKKFVDADDDLERFKPPDPPPTAPQAAPVPAEVSAPARKPRARRTA
jgi:hypothetical protein